MVQRIPPRILAYKKTNKQRSKKMNIINQSGELTKMQLYKMTEGKKSISVKDAVGLTFRVWAWCEYEDQNERGDKSHVLSILATDGSVYTTVSDVFRRSFMRILEVFGDDLPEIEILEGQTKNNRTYYDCTAID